MAEFSVLGLSPRVDFSLGGQRQAVLPSRVYSHFPDVDVLDGL